MARATTALTLVLALSPYLPFILMSLWLVLLVLEVLLVLIKLLDRTYDKNKHEAKITAAFLHSSVITTG